MKSSQYYSYLVFACCLCWTATAGPTLKYPILFIHGYSSYFTDTWMVKPGYKGEQKIQNFPETTVWEDPWGDPHPPVFDPEWYAKYQALRPPPGYMKVIRRSYEGLLHDKYYAAYVPGKNWAWVASYCEQSTPLYIAQHYGIDRAPDINKNGLYFYQCADTWTPIDAEFGQGAPLNPDQTQQLYERLIEVLDFHYARSLKQPLQWYGANNPSGELLLPRWRTDPDAKIVLVCHSQAGLVARNLYRRYSSPARDNPLNHIERIVTVSTPHLGSPWASDPMPYPQSSYMVTWNEWMKTLKSDLAQALGDFDTKYIEDMMVYRFRYDPAGKLLKTMNAAPYPTNGVTGVKVPIVALSAIATGLGAKLQNALWLQLDCSKDVSEVEVGLKWLLAFTTNPMSMTLIQQRQSTFTACDLLDAASGASNGTLNSLLSPLYKAVYTGECRKGDESWEQRGDFVVSECSQLMEGLYPGAPIVRKRMQGAPIPHIRFHLDSLALLIPWQANPSTDFILGSADQGKEILEAIEMPIDQNVASNRGSTGMPNLAVKR